MPVRDWLDAMRASNRTTYDRIINYIDRIEMGSTSNLKPEGEGVTALKMDFGPGYRIYLGQDGNDLVILLIAGDKSSQTEDIRRAKEYWRDYNA